MENRDIEQCDGIYRLFGEGIMVLGSLESRNDDTISLLNLSYFTHITDYNWL